MTVALRGHHLLCILSYVGKGYSPAFVANYDRVIQRLADGEIVEIVAGPDAICAPLLSDSNAHCYKARAVERDRLARIALQNIVDRPLDPGCRVRLTHTRLDRMRRAFTDGRVRTACHGCEWRTLCSQVAGQRYRGTRLAPR